MILKVFFEPLGGGFWIQSVLIVSPLKQDVRIVGSQLNGFEPVLFGRLAHFGRRGKRGENKFDAGVFVVFAEDRLKRFIKPRSFLGAGRQLHDGLKQRGWIVGLFKKAGG